MSNLRILIVEDEFLTIESLRASLLEVGYAISGIARDPDEGITILNEGNTDFAIVDINLQGEKSGIWLAEQINQEYKIPFLFLTANGDKNTVERAITTQPYGYLLKPFTNDAIFAAIEVAISTYEVKIETKEVFTIEENKEKTFFFLKEDGIYKRIVIKEIEYAQSHLKYVEIYTKNQRFVIRKNLSDFLLMLPTELFLQIHKSYIVNLQKIEEVGQNYVGIGESKIPYSLARKTSLLRRLGLN